MASGVENQSKEDGLSFTLLLGFQWATAYGKILSWDGFSNLFKITANQEAVVADY